MSTRIYGDDMSKAKVTISLDEKKWTEFRIKCLRLKRTASAMIEEFIDNYNKNKK